MTLLMKKTLSALVTCSFFVSSVILGFFFPHEMKSRGPLPYYIHVISIIYPTGSRIPSVVKDPATANRPSFGAADLDSLTNVTLVSSLASLSNN